MLISDQNINPALLAPVLQRKGEMRHSDLFILTRGLHPNAYEKTVDEVLERIVVDEAEFTLLERCLKSQVAAVL